MKNSKFLIPFASLSLLLGSCNLFNAFNNNTNQTSNVKLEVSNAKTSYELGEEFERPTVTIIYSEDNKQDVSDRAEFSGYDTSISGTQTVLVSYNGVSTSYVIYVNSEGNTGEIDPIEVDDDEIESDFKINTSDGVAPTVENNVYTISEAGTYKISGKLDNGQIYIDAEDKEVELELNETSISCDFAAPIYVKTADSVDIKVKKETTNHIYDNRENYDDSEDNDEVGSGAIYIDDGDFKIKGTGTLAIIAYANNGIHGKDDVTIKNATLVIKAVNNGIKGNDSVTIEETPSIDIICGNDGIKTNNSDLSNKGKQRGDVTITGGQISINSYGDGIDASYRAVISDGVKEDDDGNQTPTSPVLNIYTNKYSAYTTSSSIANRPGGWTGWGGSESSNKEKAESSAKGIKASEDIVISGGTIYTETYDDSLHGNAESDDEKILLDNGNYANGNVTISGGVLKLNASDDGIHADGTLDISGGNILVRGDHQDTTGESYEGIEGNVINISGGDITVFASDDGVNAQTSINISGGRLDVTVSPSGDKDGIDSNGTITITGGIVITRGPNSNNMSPIDADGTIRVNGGTLVVVGKSSSSGGWGGRPGPGGGGMGEATIQTGSGITTSTSSSGLSLGSHTVTFSSLEITYTISYTYSGGVTIYSELGSASVK